MNQELIDALAALSVEAAELNEEDQAEFAQLVHSLCWLVARRATTQRASGGRAWTVRRTVPAIPIAHSNML